MKQAIFILFAFVSLFANGQSQTAHKTLIRYATAHLGNGEKIDNSYIELQGESITRVADANTSRINESDYDTIIEADGKHTYPGFIIMDSRLGLTEIDAVLASHDYQEVGDFLPNVRALPAFNSESKIIATVRTNGVLMAQIAPTGLGISGQSSAVHFNGWNWQDASVKADEGAFLTWPNRYNSTGWWAEPGKSKVNQTYGEQTQTIKDYFSEAQAYSKDSAQHEKNLRFEAMRGVYNDSKRLYVRVNWAKDILDVVQFIRANNIKKATIVGGAEAHLVTTELRENNIAVIIDRVHKLPIHEDAPIDEPFKMAATLVKDGVSIAFATSGGKEAMISRNLPFQVGTAVHYGLDYETAIQSITQTPAKLMGIDDVFGTLESGKSATLFICEGDALDMTGNHVITAFIKGQMIDLTNHQTELNERFAKKLGVEP
jgi:hypothetical protein